MAIASKAKIHTPALRRGSIVREHRIKKNLYQADVAKWINNNGYNLNMTQKRISQIEGGSDLKGSELFAIADCFGITVEDLRCL